MRTDSASWVKPPLPALNAVALLLCALLCSAAPVCGETPAGGETIEQLWARGETAFKTGNLDEALRLFHKALSGDQRRARSWNYIGGIHFAQGDLSLALGDFRLAHELDPEDVRACNNLGTVLERLGDYTGAEQAYGQAVRVDPSYPVTQRNLGILYSQRLGNRDAARRAWQRYLELAPAGAHADEIRRELAALDDATQAPAPPAAPPTPAQAATPAVPPVR